jgi:hypothetical protein
MMQNAPSVVESASSILPELQRMATIGDYIKFCHALHPMGLGEVVDATPERVHMKIFKAMDSAVMRSYSLPPMNPMDHPMASQDKTVEAFQTAELFCVLQHNIADVAFILPIQEVESGHFFSLGCREHFRHQVLL